MRALLWSTSSSPQVGRLEFSKPRKHEGYFVLTGTLAVDGEEWSADVEMIGAYLSDLVGFFADMAKHHEGWSGGHVVESGVRRLSECAPASARSR